MVAVSSKITRETARVRVVLLDATKRSRAKPFVFLAFLESTTTKRRKQSVKNVILDGTRLTRKEIVVLIARRDAQQHKRVLLSVNCAVLESTKIQTKVTRTRTVRYHASFVWSARLPTKATRTTARAAPLGSTKTRLARACAFPAFLVSTTTSQPSPVVSRVQPTPFRTRRTGAVPATLVHKVERQQQAAWRAPLAGLVSM